MARLADTVRTALGDWWNLALSAGYGPYTATDTVAAAADLAGQANQQLTFAESSAIATLFGYARRMSNAADVVAGLQPQDVITPDAIAVPPWARDEREMATYPVWHIHFDFTYVNAAGDIVTGRKVSVLDLVLPDTFGELLNIINADAEAMAKKYDVEFIAADLREIHAV